jgi:hypothetical protein
MRLPLCARPARATEGSVGIAGGGLSELAEEVNDGKIQFGYVRVVDGNTGLHKLLFISWVRAPLSPLSAAASVRRGRPSRRLTRTPLV